METLEEANGNSESMHIIAKGKRTKRQRVLFLSAPPPTVAASSSTSSAEFSASTAEEEEDMANCLILLAQGRARDPQPQSPMQEGCNASVGTEKFTSRRIAEATTTKSKAGFYVYECKTCNKCFPSFQALGGHRASHKKPKMVNPISVAPERKDMEDDDGLRISLNSFSKPIMSLAINNSYSKPKVHECSICGAEFSSGQALGGHMRRHRPLSLPEPLEAKKERNILSLDLNLPAPSDDDHGEFPRSPFVGKQPLLLSATALVDCHY